MNDCLFCKIIAGEIPSAKVYEDEHVYAFRDINPLAPTHILILPKAHIPSANAIDETNSAVVAHIFELVPRLAAAEGLDNGYRRRRTERAASALPSARWKEAFGRRIIE